MRYPSPAFRVVGAEQRRDVADKPKNKCPDTVDWTIHGPRDLQPGYLVGEKDREYLTPLSSGAYDAGPSIYYAPATAGAHTFSGSNIATLTTTTGLTSNQ